ncbi:MAG: hypothetical protein AAFX94_21280 [Myxococcota bacterium]
MDGKTFREHLSRVDPAGLRVFQEHGKGIDGRQAFVDQIVDEAMLKLAFGDEIDWDER